MMIIPKILLFIYGSKLSEEFAQLHSDTNEYITFFDGICAKILKYKGKDLQNLQLVIVIQLFQIK